MGLHMKKEETFEEYMEYFKGLTLREKQGVVLEQLKLLASSSSMICREIGSENEVLSNKELLDMNKESYTEDDFAEAVLVLVSSIQNSMCDFHLKFTEVLENIK